MKKSQGDMFALTFSFPANRYHATPWGKNVNEADVAWPPEPWRLLRALIAAYWRKGDRDRWSESHLESLINRLAEKLPVYQLPRGTVHSHTRHYMPLGKPGSTGLVFDAFVAVPKQGKVIVAWPDVSLDSEQFELAADLAEAIGYLGRAESWTECKALSAWNKKANCIPANGSGSGSTKQLLAPLSPSEYEGVREKLIDEARVALQSSGSKLSKRKLNTKLKNSFRKIRKNGKSPDTLPTRLLDALMLDTGDYHAVNWNRPPASKEVPYHIEDGVETSVIARAYIRPQKPKSALPTVARYILAGRPRPRVEDTVRISEVMRNAAMSKFSFFTNGNGQREYNAPKEISGRDENGETIKDPTHPHAFWFPEDADDDGLIDHVSVYIASGIRDDIQKKLDRITRLWLPQKEREWRLALEGFADPEVFPQDGVFGKSKKWQNVTPFMATRYPKKSMSRQEQYESEIIRLIKSRELNQNFNADEITVKVLDDISVGGRSLRAIQFHRFRSRGREKHPDTAGALLEITFPKEVRGPIALGYGSHFGLGLFRSV